MLYFLLLSICLISSHQALFYFGRKLLDGVTQHGAWHFFAILVNVFVQPFTVFFYPPRATSNLQLYASNRADDASVGWKVHRYHLSRLCG